MAAMRAVTSAILLLVGVGMGVVGSRVFTPGRDAADWAQPRTSSGEREDAASVAFPPEDEACAPPPIPTLAAPPRKGPEQLAPFAPGTATLRIGDGYVFGDDHARPGATESEVDLLCQDIRGGVTLACPRGALPADLPLRAVGLPNTADLAAMLLSDAPHDLPERHASLSARPSAVRTGIALVRGANGATYKVWLLEERADVNALLRLVKLGYAEVPVTDGGGVLRIGVSRPLGLERAPTLGDVKRLVQVGRSIPGSSFANFLEGAYEAFDPPAGETVLDNESFLVLDGPLRSTLSLRGGAVYAAHGVDSEGRLRNSGYAAFAVKGDMAGKIDVQSYAYIHIQGDLVGEVDAGSYATVVIDGDVRGTLKVRSYVTLLLRGRVIGKIDPTGACWSTFWFAGTHFRSAVEGMEGNFGQVTLHVEASDAPQGKVDPPLGSWREVIVADPAWSKLGR